MGEETYNRLLKRVLLLPFDARDVATLGEIELGRYRALEALLKIHGWHRQIRPVRSTCRRIKRNSSPPTSRGSRRSSTS
jgi:hypothetical protein